MWGGYPGQSGGSALADILSGKAAPAGRLPTTQYPSEYVDQVPMTDMTLRPSNKSPGRTYKWYTGNPVYEFGHGLHYTTFNLTWKQEPASVYQTSRMPIQSKKKADLETFDTFEVAVENTGNKTSDYVALLFLTSTGGPAPLPKKELVAYTRLHDLKPGTKATAALKVTIGSLARADEKGNFWVYSGSYKLTVDTGSAASLIHTFEVKGDSVQISEWPQDPAYK